MKGKYIFEIADTKIMGLRFRITNQKTNKVAKFSASKKATENGKYFFYLLNDAITRTK